MHFIDHTGHIFSLPEYPSFPIGYEFDEQFYTFWMNDEYSSSLSVDCMYILPIRPITDKQIISIEIIAKETKNFRLISSTKINDLINDNKNVFDEIEISFSTDEALEYSSDAPNDAKMKLEYVSEKSWKNENGERPNDICVIQNLTSDVFFYHTENNKEVLVEDETRIYETQEISGGYSILDNDSIELLLSGHNIDIQSDWELADKLNALNDLGLLMHKYYLIDENDPDGIAKDSHGNPIMVFKKTTEYSMLPFYVIGSVAEFGTWQTNLLIHIKTSSYEDIYCPITVGGTFVDEQEELNINGQNIGLSLPKDICKALYESSFWNESPNMSLWNQKIKEYLLNYMKLHGERGNFQSAISALKWFGYGNRIKLFSLIQTDNEFISQYILNNFDIQFDVINEFKYFRNSTLISLQIPGVVEDEDSLPNEMDFTSCFWGEGKPKTKNMFDELVEVRYDEKDIPFIKPLYDWTFNELALKLCALKYYYQKYFLPVHLCINRASVSYQCFANDIKLLNVCRTLITEQPIYAINNDTTVLFPESNTIWLSEQNRLIDENWIEDKQVQIPLIENNLLETIDLAFFEIKDNCFNVPIRLLQKNYESNKEEIFNCKLIAYQDDKIMKECNFSICSNVEEYVINFIIYPKSFNKNFDINFWLNRDYRIMLLCNGHWYEYKFNIDVPELDIEIGKLVYKYDYDVCKQFSKFDENKPIFNANIYLPDLVSISNINFINDLCEYAEENYVSHLKADFVEEDLLAGTVYYYYYDDGKKTLLSSAKHTLVKEGNEYFLKENKYVTKEDGKYPNSLVKSLGENQVFSSVYKNLHSLIDLYSIQQYIPTNYNFLNKVHIFDLYVESYDGNGNFIGNYEKVKYYPNGNFGKNAFEGNFRNLNEDGSISVERKIENGTSITYEKYCFYDNDSEVVKDMYSQFFNIENGEWDMPLEFLNDSNEWKSTIIEQHLYDIYLMHDFDYWYVIMISKYPIASDNAKLSSIRNIYRSGNYTFKHNRSDNKFLVNRMEFGSMDNVYHFNPEDMIVARLKNMNSLAFKLRIGSRWNFYPLGIGSTIESNFSSPSNIGIMSIKQTDIAHSEGYYSVQANYSIDNFANEFQARKTRILVSSKIPSPTPIVRLHDKPIVEQPTESPDNNTSGETIMEPQEMPFEGISATSLNCFLERTIGEYYVMHTDKNAPKESFVWFDPTPLHEYFENSDVHIIERAQNDKHTIIGLTPGEEMPFNSPLIYAYGWNDIYRGISDIHDFRLEWNDKWESREIKIDDVAYIEKRLMLQTIATERFATSRIYEIIFRQPK